MFNDLLYAVHVMHEHRDVIKLVFIVAACIGAIWFMGEDQNQGFPGENGVVGPVAACILGAMIGCLVVIVSPFLLMAGIAKASQWAQKKLGI